MVSKIKMHQVLYSYYVRGSTKIIFKANLAVGNLMYLQKRLNPIKFPYLEMWSRFISLYATSSNTKNLSRQSIERDRPNEQNPN